MQTSSTNYMRCQWEDGRNKRALAKRLKRARWNQCESDPNMLTSGFWLALENSQWARKKGPPTPYKYELYEYFGGDFLGNSSTSKFPTCWKSEIGLNETVEVHMFAASLWMPTSMYGVWSLKCACLEVHVIIKSSSKITRLLRQVSESWPVWDGSSEVNFALGSWDAACTPAHYTAIHFM